MSLTDLRIRKLTPAGAERVEAWDGRLPGFGIRVSVHGTKSFVLLYRHDGRCRRMTLGRYPFLSLADARRKAHLALAEVARGGDPQAPRRAKRPSNRFDATVELFVRTYCQQHNRQSTRRETARLLRTRFVSRWGARDVCDITKADVLKIVDEAVAAGVPSAANHALATVRVFFNWCADRGLIAESPCARLKMPARARSRDRVLDDNELAAIWRAACAMGYPFGTITQVLLLTAQRRNEVVQMRWTDLDFDACVWSIPANVAKNGNAHVVPLVPEMMEILRCTPRFDNEMLFPSRTAEGRVFSGFSKGKERLDALAQVRAFTLHDLRRTAATRMAGRGIAPHIVERVLNHVTGVLGGVAGVYNRFKYRDEVRDALTVWTGCVRHAVGGDSFVAAASESCPSTRERSSGDIQVEGLAVSIPVSCQRLSDTCATKMPSTRADSREGFAVRGIVD
jgi:integrase